MSKLNCIAIDDEPFALEILADDIQKVSFLNLIGAFSNPLDAWELIKQGKVDLMIYVFFRITSDGSFDFWIN